MNIADMFRDLGLRAPPQYAVDVLALMDPETNLMNSGAVQLSRNAFDQLMEYSSSLPTGQRPGKVWKAQFRSGWFLGRYGHPYPEGHEHHGQIPIGWWPIYVIGQPPAWPRDVRVPGRSPHPLAVPTARKAICACAITAGASVLAGSNISRTPTLAAAIARRCECRRAAIASAPSRNAGRAAGGSNMARGERLPRFGEKADEMRRRAAAIRKRNREREEAQQRQADA